MMRFVLLGNDSQICRIGLPIGFCLCIVVRVEKVEFVTELALGIAISLSFHQYGYHGRVL